MSCMIVTRTMFRALIFFLTFVLWLTATSIAYFFVRKVYSWSVGFFTTVSTAAALVAAVFNAPLIYLFTRVFKATDPAMALVGSCFGACQMLVMGLAFEPWIYYLSRLSFDETDLRNVPE